MVENHVEALSVAGRIFRFELCRKAESMGVVPVDHWWMDTRRVYGQRGRTTIVRDLVVGYFWALCNQHDTARDPEVRESYILAQLLRYTRSNAARKVFADAQPRPGFDKAAKVEAASELETLLIESRQNTLTVVEFKQKTAAILGPPALDEGVWAFYQEFTQEWLGEARAALVTDGPQGVGVAVRGWKKAIKAWGRHRGFALQKLVLDVLSYECRAALHRCYSAAWWDLLQHLAAKYHLDRPSLNFLRFWHLDHISEAEQDVPAFSHLFHGHVFGLHPIGADLIRTRTGRDLIGAWLTRPDDPEAFGCLLHSIYLAAWVYSLRRETTAGDRRKRAEPMGDLGDVAAPVAQLDEDDESRESGRS